MKKVEMQVIIIMIFYNKWRKRKKIKMVKKRRNRQMCTGHIFFYKKADRSKVLFQYFTNKNPTFTKEIISDFL